MVWNSLKRRHATRVLGVFSLLLALSSCRISYKFTGTSIDYDQTKTVSISELRELFRRQTRLEEVAQAGDFSIEGAIVGYELTPVAVQDDAFASMTRFTMTVSVHFENNANPKKNFDKTFSAYTEFDSSSLFSQVQDDLVRQLTDDITKQIFNATAEDW